MRDRISVVSSTIVTIGLFSPFRQIQSQYLILNHNFRELFQFFVHYSIPFVAVQSVLLAAPLHKYYCLALELRHIYGEFISYYGPPNLLSNGYRGLFPRG
jgi:hypothetical protein